MADQRKGTGAYESITRSGGAWRIPGRIPA